MKILAYFLVMLAMFGLGYASHQPEIKTEIKTETYPSLVPFGTLQAICDGVYGEQRKREEEQNKKEIEVRRKQAEEEKTKTQELKDIYLRGYREGKRSQ